MENLMREAEHRRLQAVTRRHFLKECSLGLGGIAMAGMLGSCMGGARAIGPTGGGEGIDLGSLNPMRPRAPHFPARAKNVIYLHMAGGPSQLELFDHKPDLYRLHDQRCPQSLLEGKTFAFIRGVPKMLGPQARFAQYGESGAWVSDHLPHFSKVVDEVSFLKAMYTDQFNHGPAQLLMHTGTSRLGRPSIGSWVTYGLGSENSNLPGFVVLTSGGAQPDAGKSVWGSGFLPSVYQGVQCRSKGDPVLYLSDPEGMGRDLKKSVISAINEVNMEEYNTYKDPETLSRIAQYELAYKMQVEVPEAMDISDEPAYIHEMYGTEPGRESLANNCLLARKLVEKGVRFVQLFDWAWDSHGGFHRDALGLGFMNKCRVMDRCVTALLLDLKQRGLLDETLVIWGGEFGRTPMQENRDGVDIRDMRLVGRDHHPDAFTVWLAGGGVKRGVSHGETDEIGFSGVSGRTSPHDLQATILHLLGFDHERLTYEFQGRDFRLTDVHGEVIRAIV